MLYDTGCFDYKNDGIDQNQDGIGVVDFVRFALFVVDLSGKFDVRASPMSSWPFSFFKRPLTLFVVAIATA